MVRKLTLVLVLGILSLPGSVIALGVGDVHLRSALDQAFDAEIDLLSVKSDELDGVKVQLASPEAFARMGTERPYFLTKLRFKPSLNAAGKAVIHVTSHVAIREPFLNFLIEVNWAKGRLVREYTVLLDPPVTLKNLLPPPVVPPVVRAQVPPPVASPLISTPSVAKSKPLAEDYPMPDEEPQASDYGPVQENDTLWRIAMDTKLGGVTIQQMILAIQRNNPHAFYEENVNNLKQGVILRIPTREEIDFISERDAQTQFSAQVDEWKDEIVYASAAEIGTGVEPVDEEEPISDAVAPADDKLELASATLEDARAPGADEAEAKAVARLENSLELAREENESAKQEQAELSEQVSELESQLADIEQVLELRNEQLARIQAETAKNADEERLSELEAVTEAEAVQSTPAPQVDTAAQSDEGILPFIKEQLEQNLTVVAGIGGAIVLLLLLILRRRQLAAADDADELQEGYFVADSTEATEVLGGKTGEDTEIPSAEELEASLLSEFSHSEMDDVQDDTGEVDPVAEADVYIAYGRYQQAEELLRQAMQHNPDKLNSHFKLLEILFTKKDADGFTVLAEELHGKGAETQDAGAWKQAQAMGHSLNPGHSLFAGVSEADALAASESVSKVVDDGGDFGLLDMDDLATDFDLNAEPGERDQQPVVDEDSLDFNLDLGSGQSEDEVTATLGEPEQSDELGEDLADAVSNFTDEPVQTKADDGLEGITEDKVQDTVSVARELEESLSAFTVDLGADAKEDEDLLGVEAEAVSIEVPTLSLDDLEDIDDIEVDAEIEMSGSEEPSLSMDDLGDLDGLEAETEVAGLGDDIPNIPMEDLDDIDISGIDISDLDDVAGAEEVLSELPELPEGSDFEADLLTELSDEVGDADEVETKLDLARAYVEMGDEEGARNILDEVISEGSDTQKKDGQELLKRLS